MTPDSHASMEDLDGVNKRLDAIEGAGGDRGDEKQWKLDVDRKLDALVQFSAQYGDYLKLCLEREQFRKKVRDSVIDKTIGSLVLAGILGTIAAIWQLAKSNLK